MVYNSTHHKLIVLYDTRTMLSSMTHEIFEFLSNQTQFKPVVCKPTHHTNNTASWQTVYTPSPTNQFYLHLVYSSYWEKYLQILLRALIKNIFTQETFWESQKMGRRTMRKMWILCSLTLNIVPTTIGKYTIINVQDIEEITSFMR